MYKRENYCIRSSTHKYVLNFLMHWTAKVVFDGKSSDEVRVDLGIVETGIHVTLRNTTYTMSGVFLRLITCTQL